VENPAGRIIGWKLSATSPPIASVLIMHGNAGCAIDRDYLAGPIHDAAPVDVYVLEYPGYGSAKVRRTNGVSLLPVRKLLIC